MKKNLYLFIALIIGLFGGLALVSAPAYAQCTAADGTIDSSGDTITCNSTNNPLLAGNGDDTITIVAGAIVDDANNSTAPTINGQGGNDLIINYGTINGSGVSNLGVGINDISGTNTIINNGQINSPDPSAGAIFTYSGLVINNGTLNAAQGSGISGIEPTPLTVINNGQINAPLAIYTGSGNDNITVSGSSTTNGYILANGGNDTVTVVVGATVTRLIDGGGADTDQLIFQLDGDQATLDAFSNYITTNNITVTSGALTFNNKSYTWSNFEQLQFLLNVIVSGGTLPDGVNVPAPPVQSGPQAICDGSVKVFRQPNGDVDVYSGFDALPPNGFLVGRITAGELAAGVLRYQDPGTAAQLGWVLEVTLSDKLIIQVFDGQGNPIGTCTPQ